MAETITVTRNNTPATINAGDPHLTAGAETVTGTAQDDTFLASNGGLSAGDSINGLGGNDTIKLLETGTLDVTAPDTMSDIEKLEGSDGDDIFIVSAANLQTLTGIDGKLGYDTVRLSGGGTLDTTVDGRYTSIDNFEGTDNTADTFKVLSGNMVNIDGKGGTGSDTVEFVGVTNVNDLTGNTYTGIETFLGDDTGNDTFKVGDGSQLTINGRGGTGDKVILDTTGTLDLTNMSNIELAEGTAGVDTIVVKDGNTIAIDGKDGEDTVRLSGGGTLDTTVDGRYTSIEKFEGTENTADTFVVGSSNDKIVDGKGGTGTDTVRLSGGGTLDTTVDGRYIGIENFEGTENTADTFVVGSSNDKTIDGKGGTGTDTVRLSGGGTLDTTVAGRYVGIERFEGTDNTADSFKVLSGNTIKIDGKTGSDTVEFVGGGTHDLSGDTYTGIETFLGDDTDNDTFKVAAGSQLIINGRGGTGDKIVLASTGTLDLTGVSNIELADGLADSADTFRVNAGNTIKIDGKTGSDTVQFVGGGVNDLSGDIYTGIDIFQGDDTANDTFRVAANRLMTIDGRDGASDKVVLVSTQNGGELNLSNITNVELVDGSDFADTFKVKAGNTMTIDGKGGNDTVDLLAEGTLDLNKLIGIEAVNGTSEANTFTFSGTLSTALDGKDGNDTLKLTAQGTVDFARLTGIETVEGSSGSDTFILGDVDVSRMTISGKEGTDTINTARTYTLVADFENLILTGTGDIDGTGNDGANSITGNGGDNTLRGMGGDDTLSGGGVDLSDNDTLIGGAGNDIYTVYGLDDIVDEKSDGGAGNDTIRSNGSYDLRNPNVRGDVENLVLLGDTDMIGYGNGLDNKITGGNGNDTLYGLDGNDTLDGGGNGDVMIGGKGNDLYLYMMGADIVDEQGGDGIDTIDFNGRDFDLDPTRDARVRGEVENINFVAVNSGHIGSGNSLDNKITGNILNDTLSGMDGNDILVGNAGNDTLDGGNGDDKLLGGAGVDIMNGGVGSDTLEGGTENDTLNGGDGDDNLNGDAGLDVMNGGAGNDTLDGGADFDTLNGGDGDDKLTGGAGGDILNGGIGNDTLEAGTENDTLLGGAGNDTLDGGTGDDTMRGGEGNDTYIVDSASDTIDESGGFGVDTVKSAVTLSLLLGTRVLGQVENLILTGTAEINGSGNALDNQITGNDAKNTLSGLNGNDTLDGGKGADTLIGGKGNDIYVVDDLNDIVNETGGNGTDEVRSSVSFTLTVVPPAQSGQGRMKKAADVVTVNSGIKGDVENLVLTGTEKIDGTGNALANVIKGNSNDNVLKGLAGNDTLDGGAGNDALDGGEGEDTLTGGIGNDTLSGGAGKDTLDGGDGQDTLNGDDGEDTLTGGIGNDTLLGGLNNDALDGGVGDDNLDGGEGNDTLNGGIGNDTLLGGLNNDTLDGGVGDDNLDGGEGEDMLTGGIGNDTLSGGIGNDTLTGGLGNDRLTGGAGKDIFVFNLAPNVRANLDTITDFNVVDDTIQLENSIFTSLRAVGPLGKTFFAANDKGLALERDDFIVYNTKTGGLFYDADANGKGAAVQIAQLQANLKLTAADFIVI